MSVSQLDNIFNSNNTHCFVIEQRNLTSLKTRCLKPECHKCRKEILIGQLVVTKQFGGRRRAKIYHYKCFRRMYI